MVRSTLVNECIAEFIGTWILVFVGTATVATAVTTGAQMGLWQVAVVWGFGLTLAIFASAHVSGAHLNPAVTIALAISTPGSFRRYKTLPYVIAQMLGAITAGTCVFLLYDSALVRYEKLNDITRGGYNSTLTAMAFGEYFPNPQVVKSGALLQEDISPTRAMVIEAAGTMFLMLMIRALTDAENGARPSDQQVPFYIGFTLASIISFVAPFTQAGLNPARDLGPRIVAALAGWGSVALPGPNLGFWVYIFGPIIGSVTGTLLYDFIVLSTYVNKLGTHEAIMASGGGVPRTRDSALRPRNGTGTSIVNGIMEEDVDIARKLSFSAAIDAVDAQDVSKVQIVIRIRPQATKPLAADDADAAATTQDDDCFRVVSDTALIAYPPKTSQAYRSTGTATSFQFTRIFAPQTAQFELFEATTRPVLDAAFAGRNGLVFAYGVTNSGKTYTISGTDEQPGVLPRALHYVMESMQQRKENAQHQIAKVTASYLEIYNDNVFDLLALPTKKRRALRLQDCDGKIQVRALTEKPIRTLHDGEDLLIMGKNNKQVAETNCNTDSSRSHCVFTLSFYKQMTGSSSALFSKVSIVDLAGSERGAKTGATGIRMQEASKINGSLMNLMRCLETLRWNQHHPAQLQKMVPFRESKLTRENLVGRKQGPVVMIVAVNPSSYEFDETLRTLKYSAVARELVPAQARPVTRRTARLYDLDGRLKKRRRASIEAENENIGKSESRKTNSTTVSEPDERDSRIEQLEALVGELRKENGELRRDLAASNAAKLEMEMGIRAEVGSEMQNQLQQMRTYYNEMIERQQERVELATSARKRRHAATTLTSPASNSKRLTPSRADHEALERTVRQLQEQLRESEAEMRRMRLKYEKEMKKHQRRRQVPVDL
ncbi:TPA: hypothetical protein N0F65_006690 [Lagenidium giganteum]|uniref:Kinesin-like protein n=1 Tax=Lagenidium giganteum TaxID=4803 RepID=A0AAV2Z5J9_9STRA|nr:TPA: hypothetical protein N0F65_006690 [Lagenidium giganteum]